MSDEAVPPGESLLRLAAAYGVVPDYHGHDEIGRASWRERVSLHV
jgi:hypothetical protein